MIRQLYLGTTYYGCKGVKICQQKLNLFARSETDPVFASLFLFGNDLWAMTL